VYYEGDERPEVERSEVPLLRTVVCGCHKEDNGMLGDSLLVVVTRRSFGFYALPAFPPL
jgi:hypothetical protein